MLIRVAPNELDAWRVKGHEEGQREIFLVPSQSGD
jgi:hypothetical protein